MNLVAFVSGMSEIAPRKQCPKTLNNRKPMNKFTKFHFAACQLISAGIISVCCPSAHGQLLFSEGFNYTPGTALASKVNPGGGTWTGGNATELQIGSSQLTYAGLLEAPGYELAYTSSASASSSYNTYAAVTSGSLYYSFLINCTTAPTANEYIAAINPGVATPGGSSDAMSTYVGASGSGWKIGIRTPGSSGALYSPTLTVGTTYLIAEQLTLGASPVVNLYVDPVPGGTQPASPTATETATSAINSVDDIGFKVQSTVATGNFDIGELLIAPDWADVTPASVPEPSTFVLLGGSLVAALKLRRRS
jgi:hypothetical protein